MIIIFMDLCDKHVTLHHTKRRNGLEWSFLPFFHSFTPVPHFCVFTATLNKMTPPLLSQIYTVLVPLATQVGKFALSRTGTATLIVWCQDKEKEG